VKIAITALAACAVMAAQPAFAQTAASAPTTAAAPAPAPAPAAPHYTTEDSTVGDLLDNPVTKAILAKHVPAIVQNDQINQARGMSLKALQPYSDESLSDAVLEAIDKDLATVPAPKP
jgi:hypothetical protein